MKLSPPSVLVAVDQLVESFLLFSESSNDKSRSSICLPKASSVCKCLGSQSLTTFPPIYVSFSLSMFCPQCSQCVCMCYIRSTLRFSPRQTARARCVMIAHKNNVSHIHLIRRARPREANCEMRAKDGD